MSVTAYPVRLGRLAFPALVNPSDTLGDGLEAVGAALVAAERRPRPLELTLHLYGDAGEPDPKIVGDRLRRQITGLLENPRVRLEGLWLSFDADPLLDSYVLIGGGKLAIDDPSLALGDFAVELEDVYRVGKATTHREARRIDVLDLTTGTTPRDIRRTRYSTDFAATPAPAAQAVPLPNGIIDAAMGDEPLTGLPVGGLIRPNGNSVRGYRPADGVIDGSVYSFEFTGTARQDAYSDVIAWDTRDTPAPPFTAAGDRDPQSVYGWEEAYGPSHPFLSIAPQLVLENGICRVRPITVAGAFSLSLERYPGFAAGYVEGARITPSPSGAADDELSASLLEWTPDRAVVRYRRASGPDRLEIYVILQRGWPGPQVEIYGAPGMRAVLPGAAAATLDSASGSTQIVGNPIAIAPDDPYLVLGATDNTGTGILVAPLENHATSLVNDTQAYGVARPAVNLVSSGNHVGARVSIADLDGDELDRASVQAAETMHPIRTVATLVAR